MTPLRFIVEPEMLLMTWQPSNDSSHSRLHRKVAEIRSTPKDRNLWRLTYLVGTPDMKEAQAAGFLGHPAFRLNDSIPYVQVRETLLRRLPPRNREDFSDFLEMHRLPNPFPYSDMALLGYTGARLPSDGFAFVPVFPEAVRPCEFILEVAGIRHVFSGDFERIRVGDPVVFIPEPENVYDSDAIAIYWEGAKVGYVNRVLLPTANRWLASGDIEAFVERKNGSTNRPVLYLRTRIGCTNAAA